MSAKRYLCWRTPAYAKKLSVPSTVTLSYQGGPMSDAEVSAAGVRTLVLHRTTPRAHLTRAS